MPFTFVCDPMLAYEMGGQGGINLVTRLIIYQIVAKFMENSIILEFRILEFCSILLFFALLHMALFANNISVFLGKNVWAELCRYISSNIMLFSLQTSLSTCNSSTNYLNLKNSLKHILHLVLVFLLLTFNM